MPKFFTTTSGRHKPLLACLAVTLSFTQFPVTADETMLRSTTANTAPTSRKPPTPRDLIVVQLRKGADQEKFNDLVQDLHGTVVQTIQAGPGLQFLIVQTEPGQAQVVQKKLYKDTDVASVELNRVIPTHANPPEYTEHIGNWGKQKQNLTKFRTGLPKFNHFIHGGKLRFPPPPPVAPPPPPPLVGSPTDPGQIYQWDLAAVNWLPARDSGAPYQVPLNVYFVDTGSTFIPGEASIWGTQYNFADPVPTGAQEGVFDAGYHGTATTTRFCVTDNFTGYAGMGNFESNYTYLVMCRAEPVGQNGGNYVGIVASLSFLANTPFAPGPICLSYNYPPPNTFNSNPQIQALAQQLRNEGFVVVLPTGNQGQLDNSPEQYIRRVAATDESGKLASFSNYGPFPAAAPGNDIGVYTPQAGAGLGWLASGTSVAAPAWCAAILNVMRVLPPASRNAVIADQIVLQTATTNPQGYKIPNMAAAIQAAGSYH